MKERWKIIKGYKNYAISTKGRVRNLNTGKLLKHQSSRRGGYYAFVNLYNAGNRKNANVHTLVATAFIGKRPKDKIAHHKDNNRMNPDLENLKYVTRLENNQTFNQKRS